jgi:GNAT superfamily N-acetyltransferase
VTELERIVEFVRAHEERSAGEVVPYRYGTAFFNRALPELWDWNYLRVDDPSATAEQLAAEAERLQAAAGFKHRKLSLLDSDGGARLEPAFRAQGWTVQRLLVMAHHRAPDREPAAVAEEVDEAALHDARTRLARSQPWGNPDAIRQVLEAKRILARGGARFFTVRVDGAPGSFCDLYSQGGVAQIEDVVTLPEHRGRGLATSMLLRALSVAREGGAEIVFLTTDEQDWPQELYSRLGFDTVGRFYGFLRSPA